jgi:hypothetical protein
MTDDKQLSTDAATGPVDVQPVLRTDLEPDRDLLDRAVEHINGIYTAHGLRVARELGEYLVETFFGGDLDAAREQGRGHASWRALASRSDLLVSHSHLWSTVQVLDQLRRLPDDIGSSLSMSHHRRLLVVKDEEARAKLAKEAVAERLNVKQLEAKVSEQRAIEQAGETRGRKPLPTFVKAIRALKKVDLTAEDLSAEMLEALPVGEADDLLQTIDQRIAALAELRARIAVRRASTSDDGAMS